MIITKSQLKKIIKEELNEVYSEKQRRWACAQMGDDFEGERSLSKKQAEEMCKGPMKKEDKEFITEDMDVEMKNVMSNLNKTMRDLSDGLKELDLSMDYLASVFIGLDPFEVGVQQRAFGRFAAPKSPTSPAPTKKD
tara:strand:+ start:349 stop:759 length:411 start_codon:yes stop_codon:yes gene_type:complete